MDFPPGRAGRSVQSLLLAALLSQSLSPEVGAPLAGPLLPGNCPFPSTPAGPRQRGPAL